MLVLWEREGEAYDKLALRPGAKVYGKGRRNGRVSEWYMAAYDLVVPAQAKKSLVNVSALCWVAFSASINSEYPIFLLTKISKGFELFSLIAKHKQLKNAVFQMFFIIICM